MKQISTKSKHFQQFPINNNPLKHQIKFYNKKKIKKKKKIKIEKKIKIDDDDIDINKIEI